MDSKVYRLSVLLVFNLILVWSSSICAAFLRGEFYLENGVSTQYGRLGRNSIGVEGYSKLSKETGDWATVALQFRLVHYRNIMMDNRTVMRREWEPEFHTTYINLKGFFGQLNLKMGHIEIPFGLESVINTHSVLAPSGAMINLATMQDWGFSLNGQLRWFDYEVALTSGAGMKTNFNPFSYDNGMYLLSARVQPVLSGDKQVGISGFFGEMTPTGNHMVRMSPQDQGSDMDLRVERRIGVDLRSPIFLLNTAFDWRFEFALGQRNGASVISIDGAIEREFLSSWHGLVGGRLWRHGDSLPDVWGILSLGKQISPNLSWEIMFSPDFSETRSANGVSVLSLIYLTH